LFHLLLSLDTNASSEFVTIITVDATSFIQRYHAFLNMMLACTLDAALIFFAEFDHVIKFKAFETLHNVTVLFKQLAFAFLI